MMSSYSEIRKKFRQELSQALLFRIKMRSRVTEDG
eukprot:COSAG01_NODE_2171_length_8236_cov_4.501905_8_plen_35_part_00